MNLDQKTKLTSFLVFGFALIIIVLGLLGEFYETEKRDYDLARIYANPLVLTPYRQLKKVVLTNRSGEFVMENQHPQGDWTGPWQLTSPQSLKIKEGMVQEMLQSLDAIHVRSFLKKEPINISSFSLDRPTLKIQLESLQSKSVEIFVGLINPIDQSAYMTFSGQDQIFQIEPLDRPMETWDLPFLAESKLFAFSPAQVISIEVYQGIPASLKLHLFRQGESWTERTQGLADNMKVQKWIQELNDMKAIQLLEGLPEEWKKKLETALESPDFSFNITTLQGTNQFTLKEWKEALPPGISSPTPVWLLMKPERKSIMVISRDLKNWLSTNWSELKFYGAN